MVTITDRLDELVALLHLQGAVGEGGGRSLVALAPLCVAGLRDVSHGIAQGPQP